jgi:hypothetical protein
MIPIGNVFGIRLPNRHAFWRPSAMIRHSIRRGESDGVPAFVSAGFIRQLEHGTAGALAFADREERVAAVGVAPEMVHYEIRDRRV